MGEAFRRDRRQSTMSITRIDAGAHGVALALPESCRVAPTWPAHCPRAPRCLWPRTGLQRAAARSVRALSRRRLDDTSLLGDCVQRRRCAHALALAAATLRLGRAPDPKERAPQFFTAEGVNDRTPPPPPLHLPTANELQMLRDAGCQGLALELWGGEKDRVEAAEAEARIAQQLVEWADAANLAVVVDQGR